MNFHSKCIMTIWHTHNCKENVHRAVNLWGTRWRSGWGTALQTGSSRVRFPMVSLDFFFDIILPVALWTGCQKRVAGIFPWGKGGRCVRLTTLTPSLPIFLKSGRLNLLEPSGTVKASKGIALFYCSESVKEQPWVRLCLFPDNYI
jgi:hypothetical protein